MVDVDIKYREIDKEIEYDDFDYPEERRCIVCGEYKDRLDTFGVGKEPFGVCLLCAKSITKEWISENVNLE